MSLSQQEIKDRIEINEVLIRYCHAVDDQDWDLYRSVFTPDAIIDDSHAGGLYGSVEEHIDFMKGLLANFKIIQHNLTTVSFDIKSSKADTRAYCFCPTVFDAGDSKTHVALQGLWYDDQLVRTSAGWRITKRVEKGYWNYNMPEGIFRS